jgi:putative tryptophan/tyrosine transport system substrate-binding protein
VNRRRVLAAGAVLLLGRHASAQPRRPPRIHWTSSRDYTPDLVRDLFKARGRIEGRDLRLSFEQVPELMRPEEAASRARNLVAVRPDILVVEANPILGFLAQVRDLPIVFYNLALDPKEWGLVESLRRPGRNFTGTTMLYFEMLPKVWELLARLVPSIKRAALMMSLDWKPWGDPVETFQKAADGLGIKVQTLWIPQDATAAEIAAIVKRSDAQGVWLGIWNPTPELFKFLKESRIPAVTDRIEQVEKGVIAGLGWTRREGEEYAVGIVERILRGESPATIPVYVMDRWRLVVNVAAARAAGIPLPHSLLVAADETYGK